MTLSHKFIKTVHDVGITRRYWTKEWLAERVGRRYGRTVSWGYVRAALPVICRDMNTNVFPIFVPSRGEYTFTPSAEEVNEYEKAGLTHMSSRGVRHISVYDKATIQLGSDYQSALTEVGSVRPPREIES